ncbi:MAG TPA: MFS transporter [Acidimicrobiia bacterium]|jgi:MFS family permease
MPDRQTRSVIALLTGMFTSASAVVALTTALGKQVYDLTGSEFALGLLGLAEFAPNALLVLVTGTLADRYDRRLIVSISMVGQALVVAGLAWYAAGDPTSAVPIFVLVVLFGIARAFAWPALRALPPDVVERSRIPWLTVRGSATFQAAMIVGPVLGGFLYAADVALPYVAVAVMLVVGAVVIRLVQVHPVHATTEPADTGQIVADATLEVATEAADGATAMTGSSGRLKEAMAGFVFIRHEPLLLGAITLDLFAVLFGGAVALLPAIAEERLGVGAVGLGWLRAAIGIGAAAMTLWLAWRPLRRRVGPTLFVAVAAFGVGTIVLGVTTSFAVAFAALVLLSAADAISVFIRGTLVPLVTPVTMRGRVLAFEMVFIGASNELGAFESGVAGQLLGPAAAVVLGGVGTLVIAGAWAGLFPALRHVDRFPGLDDDAPRVEPRSPLPSVPSSSQTE